ncbi:MAG TPA: hypothetical protein VGO46_10095 [Gemmatimonadaceae bacterium]|nr:hypothetical protein [Gemmatimonadaceae bacterium]
MKSVTERETDLNAARLAMLALRASVSRKVTLSQDRVRIDPDTDSISTSDAAELLASLPKPLVCRAENVDSQLVVSCTDLAGAREFERHVYANSQRMNAETGGFMSYISDRYGEGDHLVAAFGRDETLVIPMSTADRWARDYLILAVGMRGDNVDNFHSLTDPDYVEAKRRGAKGLLRFSSSEDSRGQINVELFELPIPATASEEERERVAKFLVESAKRNLLQLQTDASSRKEDDLEQRNARFRAWVKKSEEGRKEHWKNKLVPDMEEFFGEREIPPEVAEFIRTVHEMG